MKRTYWTDGRLDDAFVQLRDEIRELRREVHGDLLQTKLLVLGSFVTLMAALIALHG